LFGHAPDKGWGAIGLSVARRIRLERFQPVSPVRDILRISMAVVAADHGVIRKSGQDGWTREIELEIPVEDPQTWKQLESDVAQMLKFLTGDIWQLKFKSAKHRLVDETKQPKHLDGRIVSLLSGGADSLVGALDLAAHDQVFTTISQTSSDAVLQRMFATVASAKRHLAWTHGVHIPSVSEDSQRARSMGFFAFGLAAAASTDAYSAGDTVELHASENGLISLNPPLTPTRIGSASTRTTHPCFIAHLQSLLDRLRVNVTLTNKYQRMTKGEMFSACEQPETLSELASRSMSCGKSRRINMHCGRCVPCIIRRAAFHHSNIEDRTVYKYGPDGNVKGFQSSDDVRCAYLGSSKHNDRLWIESAIMPSLFECHVEDRRTLIDVAQRGLKEVHSFLSGALS
jgi:hypothetical protein